MKFGTDLQVIGCTFFAVSAITSVLCDYVWAYHFATHSATFPTSWRVFELSINFSAVVVCITTALFVTAASIASGFNTQSPRTSDHLTSTGLAVVIQPVIFVSPHLTDRFNPFLVAMFTTPIFAGFVFSAIRQRNQKSTRNAHTDSP